MQLRIAELLNDIARNQTKILLSGKARNFFFWQVIKIYIQEHYLMQKNIRQREKVQRERKRKKEGKDTNYTGGS